MDREVGNWWSKEGQGEAGFRIGAVLVHGPHIRISEQYVPLNAVGEVALEEAADDEPVGF